MADDKKPKKKKKPSDTAAAGSNGIPVAPPRPPLDDVDRDEYADQLRAALTGTEGEAPAAQQEPPEKSFWQRLWSGTHGSGDVMDAPRAIGRGILNMVNEVDTAMVKGANALTGSDKIDPKEVQAEGRARIDNMLGKRSNDPIVGFVESASQALSLFAIGRGAGLPTIGAAAGADMFAFDPYEASLAELAARAPKYTGVHELGKLLSVEGDDSEIVARIKRGAEGFMAGVFIDELVAIYRSVRWGKAATKASSPEERAALNLRAEQEAAKARAFRDRALGPRETIEATRAADGTFEIRAPDPETIRRKVAATVDPTMAEELRVAKQELATDALTGVSSARAYKEALPRAEADPHTLIVTFDANNFGQVNKLIGWDAGSEALKDISSAIREAAEEAGLSVRNVFRNGGDEFTVFAPKDVADQVRARAEEIYGSRKYGETEVSLTGTMGNTFKEADGQLQAAKAARKAAGAPKYTDVVYHGTNKVFDEFSLSGAKPGEYGVGIYFNDNPKFPSKFVEGAPGAPNVRMARLNIQRPFTLRAKLDSAEADTILAPILEQFPELAGSKELAALKQRLADGTAIKSDLYSLIAEDARFKDLVSQEVKKLGYDGLDMKNSTRVGDVLVDNESGGHWMAFTPEQVRSPYEAVPPLKVKDAAEAQVLAAEMNHGIRERQLAAQGMNQAQAAEGFAKMRELIANNDMAGIRALMEESGHFNVSYMEGEKESLAAIEMVSRMWKETIDDVQARGQKSVEELIQAAREGLGLMTESQAHRAIVGSLEAQQGQSIRNLAADMYLKWRGQKLAGLAARMDARPHDNILVEEFRQGYLKLLETQRAIAMANSEWGRTGRMMQERANPLTEGAAPRADGSPAPTKAAPKATKGAPPVEHPIEPHIANAGWMQPDLPAYVAGMKVREIRAVATMVRLADGKPRNMYAVAHSARVIQETGKVKGALELFINNILSGFKTALTAGISGGLVTGLDVAGKIGAGVVRRDMAQAREGYDLAVSLIGEVNDSLKGMVAAIKLGRSVINPMPRHIVIGGISGELVRGQGRLLIGADEFVVVSNYRARVRARSLRLGRADGLEGDALLARVERDLEAAYDKETGMALLSEPLEAGDRAAMRTPLGDDTVGGKLHKYVSGEDWAKWVAPFVRTSVNLWRTGVETTPLLNTLYKKNREIMARGGPEAAELHARSAIAGTVYAAMFMYGKENVTGRGPSDPALRSLWLKDNKPYSVRVGGKWMSYRRGDPLGMMIGITADLRTAIEELGNESAEAAELATALVASITSNLSSKTHMAGITMATDAFSSNDGASVERWLSGIASGITVPAAIAQFNDDGTMRDVQSMADAIINRIPGWSKTLDPKFDMFGEPIMKAAGTMNRNVNPFTLADAGHSVESDLLTLGKGFSSPSRTERIGGVKVDWSDRKAWDNGTGVSPYVRMMELIREQDLRGDMEKLVRSERWKRPSGTDENPGGRRWDMASGIKEKAYKKAEAKVLREYPLLRDHRRMLMKRDAAAYRGGEERVKQFDMREALKSLGN